MERFEGRIAVVTGGGTGMGRELVRQLAAEGCHVAMCDVSEDNMAESKALAEADAPPGVRVSTAIADVSDESQVVAFADAVRADHSTEHINLLFNNAGIGGGGSFVADERAEWEKTFGVCWGGVYLCTRAFLPMLMAADEGHVVNTSSVNGFWASVGPMFPHTAYSAAKFAVRGFSEALLTDFRNNAPHLRVSVVMPGHIGTAIVSNSSKMHGRDPKELREEHISQIRERMGKMGLDVSGASDEDIRTFMQQRADDFQNNAPMTAAQAATVILDGVRANKWRILVGEDAAVLDKMVREDPENAYEASFLERLREQSTMSLGG